MNETGNFFDWCCLGILHEIGLNALAFRSIDRIGIFNMNIFLVTGLFLAFRYRGRKGYFHETSSSMGHK